MKKSCVFFVMIILIGINLFSLSEAGACERTNPIVLGNMLYVGGSGPGNFSRIQDAIDNASFGDTVFVYDDSSPYYERVVIEKTITLQGENRETTILDTGGYFNVVSISADGVCVYGFTLQNSGFSSGHSGVYVQSSNNTICDNIFLDNYDGVSVSYSYNSVVCDNVFVNNEFGVLLRSDGNVVCGNSFFNDGIATIASDNVIVDNTVNYKPIVYLQDEADEIVDEDCGQIILVNCSNITVKNQVIANTCAGIHLHQCHSCVIENNSVRENRIGISIGYSDYNVIKFNGASSNRIFGIDMYHCDDNVIESNACIDQVSGEYNHHGMRLYMCNNNSIQFNWLKHNKVGMECYQCYDNNIAYNFIGYNLYIGVKLDWFSEGNSINENEIVGNDRGVVFNDVSHNFITRNNFRSNDEPVQLNILQYLKFSLRKLPEIRGNYWGCKRMFPKLILGEFMFVYMEVPFGGYVSFRCPFFDWHPAQEPY